MNAFVICLRCKSCILIFGHYSYFTLYPKLWIADRFLLLFRYTHVQTFNIYSKEDENAHKKNNMYLATRNTINLELHSV